MTLAQAKKLIKQTEKDSLRVASTHLLSRGPRQGWAVSVSLVGGHSYIVYSVEA